LHLFAGLSGERGVDLGRAQTEARCGGELQRWQEAFQAVLSTGEVPGDALRIDRLEEVWVRRIIEAFKPREVLRVLVDGMRFDVWRYLREKFLTGLRGSYRLLEEALMWAYSPTNTETQLQRLNDPLRRGELVSMVEVVSREEYLRRRSGGGAAQAAGLIAKLDFIDHKVHAFRESMYEFYREAAIGMEIHLQPLLEALPDRSLVILFADHGFIEDPAFSPARRYESPRYRHGGNHFLEVLAPAAAVYKAGARR
jgi:hypothetical protein